MKLFVDTTKALTSSNTRGGSSFLHPLRFQAEGLKCYNLEVKEIGVPVVLAGSSAPRSIEQSALFLKGGLSTAVISEEQG
jgi:hypothetical protein